MNSTNAQRRSADVTMRIGSPALDNCHAQNRASALISGTLALDDDRDAIARELWRLTYEEYRKASKAYSNVKTSTDVHARGRGYFARLLRRKTGEPFRLQGAAAAPDRKALEKMARDYSALFRKYDYIYSSTVVITAQQTRLRFASTEGRHVVAPNALSAWPSRRGHRANDGMELMRVETFQAESIDHLPAAAEIPPMSRRWQPISRPCVTPRSLNRMRVRRSSPDARRRCSSTRCWATALKAIASAAKRRADLHQESQSTGAAGISHRDRRSDAATFNGIDLGGWYQFDDEGMPARASRSSRTGVLKDFLMSRMPIKNLAHSNGHGRSQPGLMPTGRQGNLIVSSTHTVKDSEFTAEAD